MAKEKEELKESKRALVEGLEWLKTQDGRVLLVANAGSVLPAGKLDIQSPGGNRVIIGELTDEVGEAIEHNGMPRGFRLLKPVQPKKETKEKSG